jgi:hypothetical protein
MMSGALWVKDRLELAGWAVEVAHAGKVRDIAPLACKTDKVDARVLAELCRRDLVPTVWVPSLADRAIRERLRRRARLVKLRTSHADSLSARRLAIPPLTRNLEAWCTGGAPREEGWARACFLLPLSRSGGGQMGGWGWGSIPFGRPTGPPSCPAPITN